MTEYVLYYIIAYIIIICNKYLTFNAITTIGAAKLCTHFQSNASTDNIVADLQIRFLHQIMIHSYYLQCLRHNEFSSVVNARRTCRKLSAE